MMERPHALALSVVAVAIAAALALQIVAGWPLSPRLTGPALLALSIGASAGLAFLAGFDFAGAGSTAARAAALAGLVLSVAGAWVGAGDGLLVLACGFLVCLLAAAITPARIVLAIGMAAALALSARLGPF
jgi:hypothetical protein